MKATEAKLLGMVRSGVRGEWTPQGRQRAGRSAGAFCVWARGASAAASSDHLHTDLSRFSILGAHEASVSSKGNVVLRQVSGLAALSHPAILLRAAEIGLGKTRI